MLPLPSKTFIEATWPLMIFVLFVFIVAYPTQKDDSSKHSK